ncbi:MAG: hypothetical protein LBF32_01960, partial [Streptococcaceae bacterium]|nr:hypothetical protein [Streptococcaceae bacterium]
MAARLQAEAGERARVEAEEERVRVEADEYGRLLQEQASQEKAKADEIREANAGHVIKIAQLLDQEVEKAKNERAAREARLAEEQKRVEQKLHEADQAMQKRLDLRKDEAKNLDEADRRREEANKKYASRAEKVEKEILEFAKKNIRKAEEARLIAEDTKYRELLGKSAEQARRDAGEIVKEKAKTVDEIKAELEQEIRDAEKAREVREKAEELANLKLEIAAVRDQAQQAKDAAELAEEMAVDAQGELVSLDSAKAYKINAEMTKNHAQEEKAKAIQAQAAANKLLKAAQALLDNDELVAQAREELNLANEAVQTAINAENEADKVIDLADKYIRTRQKYFGDTEVSSVQNPVIICEMTITEEYLQALKNLVKIEEGSILFLTLDDLQNNPQIKKGFKQKKLWLTRFNDNVAGEAKSFEEVNLPGIYSSNLDLEELRDKLLEIEKALPKSTMTEVPNTLTDQFPAFIRAHIYDDGDGRAAQAEQQLIPRYGRTDWFNEGWGVLKNFAYSPDHFAARWAFTSHLRCDFQTDFINFVKQINGLTLSRLFFDMTDGNQWVNKYSPKLKQVINQDMKVFFNQMVPLTKIQQDNGYRFDNTTPEMSFGTLVFEGHYPKIGQQPDDVQQKMKLIYLWLKENKDSVPKEKLDRVIAKFYGSLIIEGDMNPCSTRLATVIPEAFQAISNIEGNSSAELSVKDIIVQVKKKIVDDTHAQMVADSGEFGDLHGLQDFNSACGFFFKIGEYNKDENGGITLLHMIRIAQRVNEDNFKSFINSYSTDQLKSISKGTKITFAQFCKEFGNQDDAAQLINFIISEAQKNQIEGKDGQIGQLYKAKAEALIDSTDIPIEAMLLSKFSDDNLAQFLNNHGVSKQNLISGYLNDWLLSAGRQHLLSACFAYLILGTYFSLYTTKLCSKSKNLNYRAT